MNASLVLVLLMAVMYAAGVYVMLERSITRIVIGFVLVGNATNILLLLMSGRAGAAAFWQDGRSAEDMTDPLPQALVLTAIVIGLALACLGIAVALALGAAGGADADAGTDGQATAETLGQGDDVGLHALSL